MRQDRPVAQASAIRFPSRYEPRRPLGRGAMGSVWLVRDRLWERDVALKLVESSRTEVLEAFRREFFALRGICHPHLTYVFDFGFAGSSERAKRLPPHRRTVISVPSRDQSGDQPGDQPGDSVTSSLYYTAEFIEGKNLLEFAKESNWPAIRKPLCDAIEGLRVLHAMRHRHGDFKPSNVMVRPDGRGVLIDLGCSRSIDLQPDGTVSGTNGFIAPELLDRRPADERADLFAVGATLRRLAEIARCEFPKAVSELSVRLVRDDPTERPSDAAEVLEALGVEPRGITSLIAAARGRLAGRGELMSTLQKTLSLFLAGQAGPRIVLLYGPPGVGKTRVMQEAKWEIERFIPVVEGNPQTANAFTAMLELALDEGDKIGDRLVSVLSAREKMCAAKGSPRVLVLDDIQRLAPQQVNLLQAFARSLDTRDPVLLLLATLDESFSAKAMQTIRVEPLDAKGLIEWVGDGLPPSALKNLLEASKGYPREVRALVQDAAALELGGGHLRAKAESCLAHSVDYGLLDSVLSPGAKRFLVITSSLEDVVTPTQLLEFGISDTDVQILRTLHLVDNDGLGWKLTRVVDRRRIEQSLGHDAVCSIHAKLAASLQRQIDNGAASPSLRSLLRARQTCQLAEASDSAAAVRQLLAHADDYALCFEPWARAAQAVASLSGDPKHMLLSCELDRQGGRVRQAHERLLALSQSPAASAGVQAAILRELGACALALGDAPRAIEQTRRASEASATPIEKASCLALMARALNQQGSYREALTCADEAASLLGDPGSAGDPPMDHAPIRELRADIELSAVLSLSYLGDFTATEGRLSKSTELLFQADPPTLVRAHATRALIAYRRGNLQSAADGYRCALELAEQHELSDRIATTALNYGTVCHQRGEWAEALRCYERGMRIAVALGQRSTEVTLRFNIAKLYADIGLFERSEAVCLQVIEQATSLRLWTIRAATFAVLGDIATSRGLWEAAETHLKQASAGFVENDCARERAEVDLQMVELDLRRKNFDSMAVRLAQCETMLQHANASDVLVRSMLARARWSLETGKGTDAQALAQSAYGVASSLDIVDLQADAQSLLAKFWEARRSPFLAMKHRLQARELWERAAAGLSASDQQAFWLHPRRSDLVRSEHPAAEARSLDAPAIREQKLRLLLDINKRINSSLRTQEVLERAMDAAIELTSAERGFLLLVTKAGTNKKRVEVAVARNIDKEQVGKFHLKFSRAIAERVLASGQPVVTDNAQEDERFHLERSVHAMRLQSVVCVPAHSPSGILGALYLDNRFRRGGFSNEDVDILLAFADQVAIALTNARLHAELETRNRELELERQRVEELVRGQATEIDRLQEQVKRDRSGTIQRYDYGRIVGNSTAMLRVFATLDRVIETTLPVLVQGESGTGKELIARAIHENGPQKKGPLVCMNCAAFPEALLESELFGYMRGAFTGADRDRDGLFVQARDGTLFLDELGEMPLSMQAKLLRVLQEREVRPLGSSRVVAVDFRLVCATNRDLRELVARGAFREDLFYRVGVIEISLPPLRERTDDIPLLVDRLLARLAERLNRKPPHIEADAIRKLMRYSWPGNVRQLENVLARALVLARNDEVAKEDIELSDERAGAPRVFDRTAFEAAEKDRMAQALRDSRWNVSQAAAKLGIPRATMYRKMARYALHGGSRSEHPSRPERRSRSDP